MDLAYGRSVQDGFPLVLSLGTNLVNPAENQEPSRGPSSIVLSPPSLAMALRFWGDSALERAFPRFTAFSSSGFGPSLGRFPVAISTMNFASWAVSRGRFRSLAMRGR